MKLKLLISILILATLACGSTSTPIHPAISLDNMVQTAAAEIAAKTAQAAALQPATIPVAIDTPIPPSAPSQEALGKVGETITQNGYIVTLMNIEIATQYGDFSQAAAGNEFISVELLIESGAPSGVSANPFYATIKDVNGYTYSFTVFGKDPALQSQNDLPMGEKMRGWITFEIPQTATNLVLIYNPITFSNDVRIRFDLGQ